MAKLPASPNLFWRTFILIMLLIVFSVTGWLQSFRVLNETPYVLGTAQQIVSMANLTRYALVTADPVYRPDLLMVLAKKEGLRVLPKEPSDVIVPLSHGVSFARTSISDVEAMVRNELGPDTVMASSVNGKRGLWVSVSIDGDSYLHRSPVRHGVDLVGARRIGCFRTRDDASHPPPHQALERTFGKREAVRPRARAA